MSTWLDTLAGNASSAKEVQAFVLDAFTNDVVRLTEDILPVFMSTQPEVPKVRLPGLITSYFGFGKAVMMHRVLCVRAD